MREVVGAGVGALGEIAAIEASTGDRPWACPWWSYRDPDVRAVLKACDWVEAGELGTRFGDDVPLWLLLGVEHYRRVYARVREESGRLHRNQPPPGKRAQLPPGFVVLHEDRG